MRIGVPREIYAGEKRVATTPEVAAQLIKLGFDVAVESKAQAQRRVMPTRYTRKQAVPSLPARMKSGLILTSF